MKTNKRLISVVVPIFNEQDNIGELVQRVESALTGQDYDFELILVDDGSRDDSLQMMEMLQTSRTWLRVIALRRNFGQTAAMSAGFDYARGDIIVPMDGDLQNDPDDIPMLIKKIDEGYDVVSGWRRDRKDPFLTRRLPSNIANYFIGFITGIKLHDYGCSLKAYKRDVVEHINLYGEMHRFVPALARWAGASVAEVVVKHHPRRHGTSKYGLNRTVKVILDLVTVKFLGSFSTKPIHIFGGMGLLALIVSVFTGLTMIYQKFFAKNSVDMTDSPFLLLTVMLMIMSVQFLLMGLLAEMLCRTYHESQNKPTYTVRRVLETTINSDQVRQTQNNLDQQKHYNKESDQDGKTQ